MRRSGTALAGALALLLLLCLVASGSGAAPREKGGRDLTLPSPASSTPSLAMASASPRDTPATLTVADDAFFLEGERFTLLSGEIHYFRIPNQYWRDRLRRVRSLGFNAITVYVPWNWHQLSSSASSADPSSAFDFGGDRNLTRFLDLAVEEDLFVIMRAPPYICAEWDFGGLPAWLADPDALPGGGEMPLRSSKNPEFFLAAVDSWYAVLLPRLRPYLAENGGPILMMQVENEFGNVGEPDVEYLSALAKMTREHLNSTDVLLFTTDAPRFVVNGSVPFEGNDDERFVAMIDSGAGWDTSDLDATFSPLKERINAPGKTPFFSSELYDGWVQFNGVTWDDASNVSVSSFVGRMRGLLDRSKAGGIVGGGGVSLYMSAGGSNTGFWAGGAVGDGDSFSAIIQSYDYAAPIAEGGSMDKQPGYGGEKRASAVRALLQRYSSLAPTPSSLASRKRARLGGGAAPADALPPMPEDPPVASYGIVSLDRRAPLASALRQLSTSPRPVASPRPMPMEHYGQQRGFIAYSARVPRDQLVGDGGSVDGGRGDGGRGVGVLFEVGGGGAIHDLGTVLVDGVSQGTLDRSRGAGVDGGSTLRLRRLPRQRPPTDPSDSKVGGTAELTVIVGMTGRSNQGTLFDTKGLNGSVLLDGREVEAAWEVFPMPFDDAAAVEGVDLDAAAAAAASSLSSASSDGGGKAIFTVERSGPLLLRGSFDVSAEQAAASSIGEWEDDRHEDEGGERAATGRESRVGRGQERRRHPADTYLDFRGLSRGVAFVNGLPLGWYDLPEGPQMRIYVPGVWLRPGRNVVTVLEVVSAEEDAAVATVVEPDFFGPKAKREKEASAAANDDSAISRNPFEESLLRFPGAGSLRTQAQAMT